MERVLWFGYDFPLEVHLLEKLSLQCGIEVVELQYVSITSKQSAHGALPLKSPDMVL